MTDERRLELERYFDGELPDRHAEAARLVSVDGAARLYVHRLARLRALARAHESAASRPAARALASRRRIPRGLAALAASAAAMVVWWGRTAPEVATAPGRAPVNAPATIAAPSGRLAPIREVELYSWANRDHRRPETVAGAVLLSAARSGRRPASVEVLALDLANASPALADELEPLALLHKPPPGGRGRAERRPRRPHPAAPRT